MKKKRKPSWQILRDLTMISDVLCKKAFHKYYTLSS